MPNESKRVYRNWSRKLAMNFAVLFGVLVVALVVMLPLTIASGGIRYGSRDGHGSGRDDVWMPANRAVPMELASGAVVALLLLLGVRKLRGETITTDGVGVVHSSAWGKVVFRARWDEISGVSEDLHGHTVVSTAKGPWLIDNEHPHIGAILAEIRERTGHKPN